MRRVPAVLAVLAAALLAACGDQTADVETSVRDILGDRGYPNATVECPESVEVEKGTTFDCTVSGTELSKVTLRINDDEGQDVELISGE